MKTTTTLTLALMLAGASVHAAQLANGLTFQTPAGWTVRSNDKAAMLLPPDLVTEPGGGANEPSELYIVAMPDRIPQNINERHDPRQVAQLFAQYLPGAKGVTADGVPQPFRGLTGVGYLYRFCAMSQGVGMGVNIYISSLPGGSAAVLLAIARPDLLLRREALISAVAASLGRPSALMPDPVVSNTAVTQWDQRMRGRKLYLFNNYSGSYGSGGMSSQKTLLLAADGTYQFRRSSSVSIYAGGANGSSASQNSDRGRWRIYQNDSRVVLELVNLQGTAENIILTSDGSKTLLNGHRWLVGD